MRTMLAYGLFFYLLMIVTALAEDDLLTIDNEEDLGIESIESLALAETTNVRKVRLIDDADAPWRNAQRIPQEEDPQATEGTNPPLQKRRRLRKRKRRPFLDEQGEVIRLRRRRPVRLDEADDGWKEMAAESPPRIYTRRRTGPIFERERKAGQDNSATSLATLQEIKEILKHAGGLSLSEILLQKNLTLSDLLSGSHNAISALSERPTQNMSTRSPMEVTTEVRNTSESDYMEITTDKRIFVPSHPKYYTAINYRPEFQLVTEAPQIEVKTTRKLPMTSAQLNMKIQKARKYPTTPTAFATTAPRSFSGPLKMSFNLEDLGKQNNLEETTVIQTEAQTTIASTTRNDTTGEDSIQNHEIILKTEIAEDRPTTAKLVTTQKYSRRSKTESTTIRNAAKGLEPKNAAQSAKDEIMEVISNEQAQNALAMILIKRNMTIDELVEQRERGFSQRHLAEIFHNSTTNTSVNGNNSNRQSKQYLQLSTTTMTILPTQAMNSTTAKSLEDVSMSKEDEESHDIKPNTIPSVPPTTVPIYKIETNKGSKEIPVVHIPNWKTTYPRVDKKLELDAIDQSLDTDLNSIARIQNNLDEYDDYIQLPIGVKSALFASLAIIGMSLGVFLTILVVFRWSQKHRRQLCDADTTATSSGNNSIFSCSKIKTPILHQEQPRRTIRTFVSETLGKRNNFYAQRYRQSMSDTWENNELPYQ